VTHFLVMIMLAALIGISFTLFSGDSYFGRERVWYGVKVFAEFVGLSLFLAWLMYFLPL
jgi:hypothetical protein